MLIEGSQIWITINAETYKNIQGQALEQGYTIMLPVSKELHNNMQGLRPCRLKAQRKRATRVSQIS